MDYFRWICPPQKTIEEAQSFYEYDVFNPAAVFELPDEKGFALGYIREQDYPPNETAKHMLDVGYKMVSCCDPLFGVWKPYNYTGGER